jgi:hypothetical protein
MYILFAYDECFLLLQQVQLLSTGSMDLVGPLLVAMASLLDTPGGLQFPLYRVVVSISVNCFASTCSSSS